jgi:hypothetical protein
MGLEDFKSEDTSDSSKNFGEQMAEMKFGSPSYQDKEWLIEKAQNENLNDRAIAEICEVQPATIRKWRNKYSIDSGNSYVQFSPENRLLTDHQLSLVQGSVLGDGGLFKSGTKHIFKLTNGELEYLQWIKTMMPDNIFTDSCISKTERDNRLWYDLRTRNHRRFTELRNQWYTDSGKILSDGFKLDEVSLLHLYIQDGELTDQYNARITLSWPSEDEFNRLKSQVVDLIDEEVQVHNGSNGSRAIYVPSKATESFFRFIGNPMLTCIQYKWPPKFR